jgi:hypothetical protein
MGEWRLIETAPKGQWVLGWLPAMDGGAGMVLPVFWGKHNHVPLYGWIYHADTLDGENVEQCDPTHWQPLPLPPEPPKD